MPKQLVGMDVMVGPHVVTTGAGAARNRDFGPSVIGAVESRLVGAGFDVVQRGKGTNPVRVELHANLSVERSKLIMVNGKPLESEEARVQVRVLSNDGALLDSFDVAGDPTEPELANDVAAQLVERMKGSPRLMAMATQNPSESSSEAPAPAAEQPAQATAAAAPEQKGFVGSAQTAPRKGTGWPDLSPAFGTSARATKRAILARQSTSG